MPLHQYQHLFGMLPLSLPKPIPSMKCHDHYTLTTISSKNGSRPTYRKTPVSLGSLSSMYPP